MGLNDEFLIIGNPPWVTNSQLEANYSYNTPLKGNFKGLKGLDALTGKSNFDIAEYILLQLMSEFSNYNCILAVLCKTSVAKNILRDYEKYNFNIEKIDFHIFDAKKVFNVDCEAGLLYIKIGNRRTLECDVLILTQKSC